MLNSGLIIPSPARPASKANIPSPITTTPADLKNSGACFPCANDVDPKDRSASIGNVPRANANIIKKPDMNDPLEIGKVRNTPFGLIEFLITFVNFLTQNSFPQVSVFWLTCPSFMIPLDVYPPIRSTVKTLKSQQDSSLRKNLCLQN